MAETMEKKSRERLLALDVFRGMTIAGMILVNNKGDGRFAYDSLNHASWNGWTLADMVFPSFVFIMGVAIALSQKGREASGQSRGRQYRHILVRAAVLFALGVLSYFPFEKGLAGFEGMRIMGVLQRLGLVYLLASVITMNSRTRGQAAWTAGLLALYWALMKLVPVPGYGAGFLSREGNLAAYVDNLLLKGHLYTAAWDPEGLLHTIPAISSCLLGVLAGKLLQSEKSLSEKIADTLVAGNLLIIAGYIANLYFPINKNLWSPSYVMLAGGLGMCALGVLVWVIDHRGSKWWTPPFYVIGMNPLFAYLMAGLVIGLMTVPTLEQAGGPCGSYPTKKTCRVYQGCVWDGTREKCIKPGVKCKLFNMEPICAKMDECEWNAEKRRCVERYEGKVELKAWIVQNVFMSWAGPKPGSLFFSMSYVMFWMLITGLMYRRRIFIKI